MDAITRAQVVAAARSYLGTPWIHQGRLKGVGIDCLGLIVCVMQELGFVPEPEDRDVSYGRMPDGLRLRAAFERYLDPLANVRMLLPGDLALIAWKRFPMHCGVIAAHNGYPTLVHAFSEARPGRVVEHRIDESWSALIARGGAYRIRGID